MLRIFSYQIRLVSRRPRHGTGWPGLARRVRLAATLAGGLAMASVMTVPASAQTSTTSGTVSATIPVFVRVYSMNVSPGSVSFGSCTDSTNNPTAGLALPNGSCSSPAISVTNSSNAASTVSIIGSNAVPSDGGQDWALCYLSTDPVLPPPAGVTPPPGASPACATSTDPGADQFHLNSGSATGVVNTAAPDSNFGASGAAAAGQQVNEPLAILGPASSTDTSGSFSTTVTWIVSAP